MLTQIKKIQLFLNVYKSRTEYSTHSRVYGTSAIGNRDMPKPYFIRGARTRSSQQWLPGPHYSVYNALIPRARKKPSQRLPSRFSSLTPHLPDPRARPIRTHTTILHTHGTATAIAKPPAPPDNTHAHTHTHRQTDTDQARIDADRARIDADRTKRQRPAPISTR